MAEQGGSLDINAEFAKLKSMYAESTTSDKINVLLLGESGSGKTFLMRTAPGPVHIDSFDFGGSKGLREQIDNGHVLVDNRWEDEDPWSPKQFALWEKETERRIKLGYFNHIKTYMLDSATTWSAAIMNEILKRAGIPGQVPRYTHDFGPQKQAVSNWIKRLLGLPCHVIITGHLKVDRDEITGQVTRRFMTVGQNSVTVPLLFDEIWIADPKETSKGTQYRILTRSTGKDMARSRLSANGKLEQYEEPDFTNMLKKGGLLK